MIVREVLTHPELLKNFDWFNDAKDTAAWLRGERTEAANQLATRIDDGLKKYAADLAEKFRAERS